MKLKQRKRGARRIFAGVMAVLMMLSVVDMSVWNQVVVKAAETTEYDNGFAEDSDGNISYEPAVTIKYDIDGDGSKDDVYEISNAGQLYWFSGLVNGTLSGVDQNRSANAVLTKDIVVNENVLKPDGTLNDGSFKEWTPIGNYSDSYDGMFDGKNHTISGLYFNNQEKYCAGLFGKNGSNNSKNSKISNVGVLDSYFYGKRYVGGVSGANYYGSITNCYNTGSVSAAEKYVGGLSGLNYVGGTITNCYNIGSVSGEAEVGGVIGHNYNATITNCYNIGSVSATNNVGGVSGYNYNEHRGNITNCYYNSTIYTGDAIGLEKNGITDKVEGKTTEQFKNGEVAYLLQIGQSDGVWGQTIGTDDYPTLGGKRVYKNAIYSGCEGKPEDVDYKYSNTEKQNTYSEHPDKNSDGICDTCGAYQPAVLTKDKYDIDGDDNKDDVYEIGNAGQLYWFAGLVNGTLSDVDQNESANAVLIKDIVVNEKVLKSNGSLNDGSFKEWTSIGTEKSPYNGIFDGQNHTISGLYFNQGEENYVGLFGSNGGKISNVGILDSYFCGRYSVGGVNGYNKGNITNCYNIGSVSGAICVGGVSGENDKGTITNCYHIGSVSAIENVGGVSGYNKGDITNCYYDSAIYTGAAIGKDSGTATKAEGKTTEQFKNGEVAYLLQLGQSDGVWGQTIGTDDHPTLGGKRVYKNSVYSGCEGKPGDVVSYVYSNTKKNIYGEHLDADNDGICDSCGAYQPAVLTKDKYDIDGNGKEDDVYEISNAGQLYWFAGLVNGTLSGVDQNKSANAALTKDIVVNEKVLKSDGTLNDGSFKEWTPIGTEESSYTGIFEGKGHTISGLYFNQEKYYIGLFGKNNGTISNVGILDSYFYGKGSVGGVSGENDNGTIINCYSTSSVSGKDYVGGVSGENDNGTITNCYSTGSVSGEDYVGGVSGHNYEGTIKNCYYDSTIYTGAAIDKDRGTATKVEGKTTEQFKTGEVAYLLQLDQSDGVWGQTIGTDDYPALGGKKVYKNTVYSGCEGKPGDVGYEYSNTEKQNTYSEHPDKNSDGICDNCGAYQPAVLTKDKYDIDGNGKKDNVYEIGNAGQLYWFAGLVNGTLSDVDQNESANAVLIKDIVVNEKVLKSDGTLNDGSFKEWTPMGTEYSPYTGRFDGQNHTISGLYFNQEDKDHVGLFGGNGGKISNVGILDSYFYGESYVGSLSGENYYGTITNCYNTGSVSGEYYIGGVNGQNYSGIITNCYNTGSVRSEYNNAGGVSGGIYEGTIINCYNTGSISVKYNCAGGVSGENYYGTIINCYNTGSVSGEDCVGGVSGENNYKGTITNCYYDRTIYTGTAIGTDDGKATKVEGKTTEQFKTGEVAYLLQLDQSDGVWGQTIGKDTYPTLGGKKVYKNTIYSGCEGKPGDVDSYAYSNTEKNTYGKHPDKNNDGKCDDCDAIIDGIGAKLIGYSLSLSGNIGVNFYMELTDEVKSSDTAYMQFTLPNGNTSKVAVSEAKKNTTLKEGTTYYVFSCEVAAKEMTEDIKAQLVVGDQKGTLYTYTVKDYADYVLSHTDQYDAETIKVVKAMLNYGAYTQTYFNYQTDKLANADLTEEEQTLSKVTADDLSDYVATLESADDLCTFASASLSLKSETEINVYVKLADGVNLDDVAFKIDGTDVEKDELETATIRGEYYYILKVNGVKASDLDKMHTFTVTTREKTASLSYGTLTYCRTILSGAMDDSINNIDKLKDVAKALRIYNQAAEAYIAR